MHLSLTAASVTKEEDMLLCKAPANTLAHVELA